MYFIVKNSISGQVWAKNFFLGNEISAQALSSKVHRWAKTHLAWAGSTGRAHFAQVYPAVKMVSKD
jgi:hypothetical protein